MFSAKFVKTINHTSQPFSLECWGWLGCEGVVLHSLFVFFFSSSPVSGFSPVWEVFWLFSWLTIWSCGTIGAWTCCALWVEFTWLFWNCWLVEPSCLGCWLVVPPSGLVEVPCCGDWWAWYPGGFSSGCGVSCSSESSASSGSYNKTVPMSYMLYHTYPEPGLSR